MAKTKGAVSFDPDLNQVIKLYSMGCTDAEVAAFFGVHQKTIQRRKEDDDFKSAMEEGCGKGKLSLRRKQYEMALAGNVPMLIWLGKNRLEQRDRQEVDNTSSDRSMTPQQIVLSDEQVKQISKNLDDEF